MKKKLEKMIIFMFAFILVINCFFLIEKKVEGKYSFDDAIDQEQSDLNSFELIYNSNHIAQSFTPSLPKITRIRLYLSQKGEITSDLTLLIKEELIGTVIREISVSSSIIPKTQPKWIEFDFPDLNKDNERYFFICKTEGGDENNYYEIYSHSLNLYDDGIGYTSKNSGESWTQKLNLDFTFQTYGAGPILNVEFVRGLPGGRINIGIENIGNSNAENVEIDADFKGGLILKRSFSEKINGSFEPSHRAIIEIFPIIGFATTDLTIIISSDNSEEVRIEREVFVFFLYVYLKPNLV